VIAIYDEQYAQSYPSLYLDPWPQKHRMNLDTLDRIFSGLGGEMPRWLDLACGQAWHFARLSGRARMTGVDISEAQLARGRNSVQAATFICADMTEPLFPPASFDLVTNFWGGYCYLRTPARVTSFLHSTVNLVAPGGALYFEVLLGDDLAAFNESGFSMRTGFVVSPRSAGFSEWQYDDVGGRHIMASPPLKTFLEIVGPRFGSVDARHDGSFMVHLVAEGRL
jgi:SAM-dependent methyltransferase